MRNQKIPWEKSLECHKTLLYRFRKRSGVDHRKVLTGIIDRYGNGLLRRLSAARSGLTKPLFSGWKRLCRKGAFRPGHLVKRMRRRKARLFAGIHLFQRRLMETDRKAGSDHFWLTEKQMAILCRFFPKPRGKPRVDDRMVLSGIIHVYRNGMRWCDAPPEYGPHKTLYSRWKRWCAKGLFCRIMKELSEQGTQTHTLYMDATFLKAHRTACCMRVKLGEQGRLIGRTAGGLNSKLHVVTDAKGRPILMFLSAGQASDYKGAMTLLAELPEAKKLVADRGYDADWLRKELKKREIDACIPSRRHRTVQVDYDKELYKTRHLVENCFGRIKDWRRVATRYDRCPNVFLNACALAAVVKYWL